MKAIVVFENKTWSFWEKLIMFFQRIKAARKGLDVPVFSHVWIHIENEDITTHPKHGVHIGYAPIKPVDDQYSVTIPAKIEDSDYGKRYSNVWSIQDEGYSRWNAFCSGIYTLTGLWFGTKSYDKTTCVKNVAYLLGMKKYWKKDLLDIYMHVTKKEPQ